MTVVALLLLIVWSNTLRAAVRSGGWREVRSRVLTDAEVRERVAAARKGGS